MTDPIRLAIAANAIAKPESQLRAIWHQFRAHRGALFGLCILGTLTLIVVLGPFLWHAEMLKVAAMLKVKNQSASLRFPIGTDQLGRDFFARMMAAGKVSLSVGLTAMLIAIFFGTSIGLILIATASAWWPAWRAAKLNVVDALRHA